MKLRQYQSDSVTWMADHPRSILAHEPGLGKTAIAIRTLDVCGITGKVVVVAPVTALENWYREFKRWQQVKRAVTVVTKTDELPPMFPDVYIIGYSQLSSLSIAYKQLLTLYPFRAVILDEGHRLKSVASKRTQAAYFGVKDHWSRNGSLPALIQGCNRVHVLTGTPAPNHYGELYTHIQALAPDRLRKIPLKTYDDFLYRFCKTRPAQLGRQPVVTGTQNVPELKQLLKGLVLRHKKKDVLSELPPLDFNVVPLTVQSRLYEDDVFKDLRNKLGTEVDENTLRQQKLHLSVERRLLGLLKVPAIVQYVLEELEDSSEKLIIFAHHREVVNQLETQLAVFNPVKIMGGMTGAAMQQAVDRFQADPDCQLFIGQINSAGEAITLTAASRVLFAEASWTPADNYQAACRAHRIGQNDGVLASFLVIKRSLDEVIGDVLARKARMTAELFG